VLGEVEQKILRCAGLTDASFGVIDPTDEQRAAAWAQFLREYDAKIRDHIAEHDAREAAKAVP
jgi:hypothetical protein